MNTPLNVFDVINLTGARSVVAPHSEVDRLVQLDRQHAEMREHRERLGLPPLPVRPVKPARRKR